MKRLLLLLSLSVVAYSCSKPIPDLEITSSTSISFSKKGGSSIISMTAYSDWTAKCDASWVTLSPAMGTAGIDGVPTSIKVTTQANTEYDDRTGVITITSNDKIFTVSVTQKTRTAIILSEPEQTVTYEAQALTVSGQANVSKTVEIPSSASWITYTPSKALQSFDIVLNIAENQAEKDREAVVYIKGDETGIGDTLHVVQKAKPSVLFCDTPGIYSAREMVIGYTDYKSQYGFFNRAAGTKDFQIVNVSGRKYLLFTDMAAAGGKKPASPYTVKVKQNMTKKLESEFDLALTVYKYEDGVIWAADEEKNIGAILKVE